MHGRCEGSFCALSRLLSLLLSSPLTVGSLPAQPSTATLWCTHTTTNVFTAGRASSRRCWTGDLCPPVAAPSVNVSLKMVWKKAFVFNQGLAKNYAVSVRTFVCLSRIILLVKLISSPLACAHTLEITFFSSIQIVQLILVRFFL